MTSPARSATRWLFVAVVLVGPPAEARWKKPPRPTTTITMSSTTSTVATTTSTVSTTSTVPTTTSTVSTTSTVPTTTSTTSTTSTTIETAFVVRGIYDHDSSPTGYDYIAATGFTVLDQGAYVEALTGFPPGVKAWVWLGNYDNTNCTWEQSDDWIRSHVSAIAGNPNIAGYFLADEPHVWECPNAPVDLFRRHLLVKSIDPGPPTFAVIEPHSPGNPYEPYVGTVDVIAADRYPCSWAHGCVFSKIDDAIALLEAAGVPRYWAVIQAFQDGYYRLPSPDELHEEFAHWRASRMEGYVVFAWQWGGASLESYPALLDALRIENAN